MSLLDGDDAFAAMPEPLIHTIDTIDIQYAEEDLSEPISLQPEQQASSASKVPLPKPPTPSNETKLLVERIKPSLDFCSNEFYWKTTQLTGCRLKDVATCRNFTDVMGDIEKLIDNVRTKHRCDEVVMSGWNFYTTDHRLLVQVYYRHKRQWPQTCIWGWDGYRSVLQYLYYDNCNYIMLNILRVLYICGALQPNFMHTCSALLRIN